MYFHTECPDYVKKYDDPKEGKDFLKRQMFYMLSYPYYKFRQDQSKLRPNVLDLKRNVLKLKCPLNWLKMD